MMLRLECGPPGAPLAGWASSAAVATARATARKDVVRMNPPKQCVNGVSLALPYAKKPPANFAGGPAGSGGGGPRDPPRPSPPPFRGFSLSTHSPTHPPRAHHPPPPRHRPHPCPHNTH